jgi:hypothetical protein
MSSIEINLARLEKDVMTIGRWIGWEALFHGFAGCCGRLSRSGMEIDVLGLHVNPCQSGKVN